jgi:hypothetical protein
MNWSGNTFYEHETVWRLVYTNVQLIISTQSTVHIIRQFNPSLLSILLNPSAHSHTHNITRDHFQHVPPNPILSAFASKLHLKPTHRRSKPPYPRFRNKLVAPQLAQSRMESPPPHKKSAVSTPQLKPNTALRFANTHLAYKPLDLHVAFSHHASCSSLRVPRSVRWEIMEIGGSAILPPAHLISLIDDLNPHFT